MSLALTGLLLLQFFWIDNVHSLAESQFKEDVIKCLEKTSSDIEDFEALSLIDPELYRRGLEGSYTDFVRSEFGEVMNAQEAIRVRDTIIKKNGKPIRFLVVTGTTIDTATGIRAEHNVITKDLGEIKPSNIENSILGLDDTNAFAIQLNQSFERQIMNKANHLNDLMMKMFASNFFEDISLRINPGIIDSLIIQNLLMANIDTVFTFNLIDKYNEPVDFRYTSTHFDKDLSTSAYNTILFPNDIVSSGHKLLISFPEENVFVWKRLSGTLIASVLLVLIVVFAFYFAVVTIYKQKQLSEIKNDFISNMTHELKTPISTISLACEAVKDPDVGVDGTAVKSYISMIDQENKRLGKLVENVLQTALIDKGRLKLNVVNLEVDRLVREIVNTFQIRYKDKGGGIVIEKLEEVSWEVDKIHFGNVLFNLLDNSLKYCEKAPEVRVKLLRDRTGFVLSVSDNGIGIEKENQKKIFDKFYREHTGDIHNVKGHGLGLAYAKRMIEDHAGEIWVQSEKGKGSTFIIKLPLIS